MEKKYAPQMLQVKSVDRENYRIRFILSTPQTDRHGEIIDQKGWILENYRKNPVVLFGHDQSKFAVGQMITEGIDDMAIVNGNLEGTVQFAYKENPESATLFELYAGLYMRAGSVGFMNTKWMYDESTDTLTLLVNELYEFSLVNVPANAGALAKAMDEMKGKNMDKRILDTIEKMRDNKEDRFKNLGEEVKEVEETKEEEVVVEEKVEEEVPSDEVSVDEVKSAIEILFKAVENKDHDKKEIIKDCIKELKSRLNPIQADIKDSTVVATPEKACEKRYSNNHINKLVRTLLTSK